MDVLFTKDSSKKTTELSVNTIRDIALGELIEHLGGDPDERAAIKKIVSQVPEDPNDMIYRQNILKDLIANEDLCSSMSDILSQIKTLKLFGGVRKAANERDTSLYTLVQTLRELTIYVDVLENLYSELLNSNITSEGLAALRDSLEAIIRDEKFAQAKNDIRLMHDDLSNVRAAVIGVNFTPDFDIERVSTIEFVPYGLRSKYTIMDVAAATKLSTPGHRVRYDDALLSAITPKMEKHLKSHFFEIKRTLTKYTNYDNSFLVEMYEGLIFYLRSAKLAKRLKDKGYSITFPEIAPASESKISVTGFYNIRLAFNGEESIVKNDFAFTPDERIFILTGPNRGGKTIVEQALGLISVMMSLGMFVTADSCTGLPFGNILTHFPIDENLTINYGRLGEEAVRIKEIVKSSDNNTLILFNETFSTTSASDGLYLSKDLIRVLKEKGAYVIFNTHIHDLAKQIPEMNGWNGHGNIISLVMERKDEKNTFILKRAEPDSSSYARDIAEKYGITYEQMTEENS